MEINARRPRVLLGVAGSVAAVKAAEIAVKLAAFADVKVVVTAAGGFFVDKVGPGYDAAHHAQLQALLTSGPGSDATAGAAAPRDPVVLLRDADEWRSYASVREDAVLHIELRRWADLLLVAPLSANTLAKVASGQCDNLLTCVARAWELVPVPVAASGSSGAASGARTHTPRKPFLVAPAMNTGMWEHPATAAHVATLQRWGVDVIPPVAKVLACGDTGSGALAPVEDIIEAVRRALEHSGGGGATGPLAAVAVPSTAPTTSGGRCGDHGGAAAAAAGGGGAAGAGDGSGTGSPFTWRSAAALLAGAAIGVVLATAGRRWRV